MFAPCPKRYCCIGTDNYNRADADDPGPLWDEMGSDWDIDSNELLQVAGGPGGHEIQFTIPHPGGASASYRVRVRFKLGGTVRGAGIFVGADQGSDNGLYASVEHDGTCGRLIFIVAGLTSTIQGLPGLTTNEWHTLEVCYFPANYPYSPPTLRAKVTLANGRIYGSQIDLSGATLPTGAYVGLTASQGVRFDDFYFGWAAYDDQCHTQCPDCKAPCLIETDNFPGGSETPCLWDSGRFMVHDPELSADHCVSATFHIADGETATVQVNRNLAGSEYLFATLSRSGDDFTLTIGKSGSTSETETLTISGAAAEYLATLCVCSASGDIFACAAGMTLSSDENTEVEDGFYAGRSGTVDWESFTFNRLEAPNCPPCVCGGVIVQANCCPPPQPLLKIPEFFVCTIVNKSAGRDTSGMCVAANKSYLARRIHTCDPFTPNDITCWAYEAFDATVAGNFGFHIYLCKDPQQPAPDPIFTSDRYLICRDGTQEPRRDCHDPEPPDSTYLVTVVETQFFTYWERISHDLQPIDFVDVPIRVGHIYRNSVIPGMTPSCLGCGTIMYLTAVGF